MEEKKPKKIKNSVDIILSPDPIQIEISAEIPDVKPVKIPKISDIRVKAFLTLLDKANVKKDKDNYRQLFQFWTEFYEIDIIKQYHTDVNWSLLDSIFSGKYNYIINNYSSGVDKKTLPTIMNIFNEIKYII
jgi:hypothetical protein